MWVLVSEGDQQGSAGKATVRLTQMGQSESFVLSWCGIESLGSASLEECILSNPFLAHQLGSPDCPFSRESGEQKLQGHPGTG